MAEMFLGVFGLVLCVIGAVGVICLLAIKLSTGGDTKRIYAVLLTDEADIQLQMLIDTVQWDCGLKSAKIYAIDGGLSKDMADYCRSVCKSHRIIFLDKESTLNIKELF